LEEFCNSTPEVGPTEKAYDANGNIIPKDPKKNPFVQVKTDVSKWATSMQNARKTTWDFKENIETNTWNKYITLNNFMQIANQIFPILSELVPQECLNTICETQRKIKGKDSISSLAETMMNSTKESSLQIKDVAKAFLNASTDLASQIGSYTANAIVNSWSLVTSFNVYNLCPRRFNDWLEDAKDSFGKPPSLAKFTQIQKMFSNNLLGQFGKLLNNCVAKTIQKNVINELGNIR
jgi:hypothetical protein